MINLHYVAPYDMHDVSATRDIEVAVDCDSDLHSIVESFESFIRSIGFVFPGAIEINEQAHMSDEEIIEENNAYEKALKDYESWIGKSPKFNEEDHPEEWAQMVKDKREIAKGQLDHMEYLKELQKIVEAVSEL